MPRACLVDSRAWGAVLEIITDGVAAEGLATDSKLGSHIGDLAVAAVEALGTSAAHERVPAVLGQHSPRLARSYSTGSMDVPPCQRLHSLEVEQVCLG